MTTYKNILVVQTAFPGDIVLTTPLLKALKSSYTECRLTFLSTPQGCELISGESIVDNLISYDKKKNDKGILNFIRLLASLRNKKFDLAIAPHRSFRTSLLLYLANIPERIGYRDSSLSLLYTKKVERNNNLHEVERILSLLSPLGIESDSCDKIPHLGVLSEARGSVDKMLVDAGVSDEERLLAIAPGSVWPTKKWTVEGYAELADMILEKYSAKIVLLGSPSEKSDGARINKLSKGNLVDFTGTTTLAELIAVIDRCDLLAGNDSAPGHIAAARDIPVIAIFGPTVTTFGYYPFGNNVEIVEKDLYCRPCHHHGPIVCPEKHFKCMKEISACDVMKSVDKLLGAA